MTPLAVEDIRILLVFPVYNNRSTLPKVVGKALQTDLPVLVVSDGSTDGGMETLSGLPVDTIELPRHKGKGAAIRAAADWADKNGYSHIVTLDADGQHDPQDALKFIDKIRRNPLSIVIGNRDFSGTGVPRSSRFGRKFSNFWIKISSGISVSDSQSGFRAYPVEAVRRIRCFANKYHYEVEILVKGIWSGLAVQSVDISVSYSEETIHSSHFRPFVDNLLISMTYTRLVIRNLIPWPHKILFGVSQQERVKFFFLNPFKSLKMLATEKTSAREIGYATALGIFMGTLPLIASHMVAIIFVSTRLRLNRLIALNVSHLCAPPFVPAAAVEIGYLIRHGRFLTEFTVQTLGNEALQRLGEYILGAIVLAFPLGAAAGLLGYSLALFFKRFNRRREKKARQKKVSESGAFQSPRYGTRFGHRIFYFFLRWFGPGPTYVLLVFVVFYYVFVLKKPRRMASFYLKRRFPEDSPIRRLTRTYGYIYQFGLVLIDQAAMGILGRESFKIDFPAWKSLYDLSEKKKGLVLITSHFGNWKTAMAAVDDLAVPVNFLIHLEEHMEGRHFFDLAGIRDKIRVIDPLGFMGGLIEAKKNLEKGECVAVMGDRAWGSRTQLWDFLGKKAPFPVSPYYLVSATGADLVSFFTVRTGKLAFKIDFRLLNDDGQKKNGLSAREAVGRFLPKYVEHLEHHIFRYPFMWFNIFDFWKEQKLEFEEETL